MHQVWMNILSFPLWCHSPLRSISYAKRMKLLEAWKLKDNLAKEIFKQGEYLIFQRNSVLVKDEAQESETPLIDLSHEVLKYSGPAALHSQKPSYSSIWLKYKDIEEALGPSHISGIEHNSVLCGVDEDCTPLLAHQVHQISPEAEERLRHRYQASFIDYAEAIFFCSTNKPVKLGLAHSLLRWLFKHTFCSVCGSKTQRNVAGNKRICPSCNSAHYPSPSPAIISLITDVEHNKCLLVRQPRYPKGMYSCVAGFVEIGESIEETVKREVAEEVGLEVLEVTYLGSQHWPVVYSSLMLGCMVIIKSEEEIPTFADTQKANISEQIDLLSKSKLQLCPEELEDCLWVTRGQLLEALSHTDRDPGLRIRKSDSDQFPGFIWVPPPPSIANALFRHWLALPCKKQ